MKRALIFGQVHDSQPRIAFPVLLREGVLTRLGSGQWDVSGTEVCNALGMHLRGVGESALPLGPFPWALLQVGE